MTDLEKLVELLYGLSIDTKEDAEHVADHLIANGVTVQEWISVKDRLPEKWQYVLGLNEYDEGAQEPCIAFVNDRGWIACGVVGCKITHWMPLSKPPKEDSHATD